MTAIAGVAHRGRVWLAGDSRVGGAEIAVHMASPKVWGIGELVVGAAGNGPCDRVLLAVDWSRDWASEIVKSAEALGVPVDAFEALLGWRGRLYYYEDRSVYETRERYAAIGTGALCCYGYLAATAIGMAHSDRVREAVKVAARHVPTVGGKVTVVHT